MPPELHRNRNIGFALLVCGLSIGGCGDRGRPENLGPSDQPASVLLPGPASAPVRAHLDELLEMMRAESVNANIIDWVEVRTEVLAAAAPASTIPAAYPAIDVALRALNDFESYYQSTIAWLQGRN